MTASKRKAAPGAAIKASPAKKPAPTLGKSKAQPNSSILSFFKKVESPAKRPGGSSDDSIFIIDDDDLYADHGSRKYNSSGTGRSSIHQTVSNDDGSVNLQELFGPSQVSVTRDGQDDSGMEDDGDAEKLPVPENACTPPPPAQLLGRQGIEASLDALTKSKFDEKAVEEGRRISIDATNPFIFDESDGNSIAEEPASTKESQSLQAIEAPIPSQEKDVNDEDYIEDEAMEMLDEEQEGTKSEDEYGGGIEDEDFPTDLGEELEFRRYMEEQNKEEGILDSPAGVEDSDEIVCPICAVSLKGLSTEDSTRHVNGCLDGNPIPLPTPKPPDKTVFRNPSQTVPRPPQRSPFAKPTTGMASAFSKIMQSNAEDKAWQSAAQNEQVARGKRAFQRTCPFYKILPNLNVAVDAFRYGKVDGINAYFLSHFHSDHYIGLTSSWSHGPIYCSRITANLVRRQLRVDPKYVFELKFETLTEIPGTGGAKVTMIDANHCPGSSLFLFDKELPGYNGAKRNQRILHCGDFRASAEHLRHPLLSAFKGNKIDICYLDTTYLNPKYAFPPQQQVIDVCAELCVSLAKEIVDYGDDLEKKRREAGIAKFTVPVGGQTGDDSNSTNNKNSNNTGSTAGSPSKSDSPKKRGKLLVVVGTYSIGKERICMAIAKALGSKIYASQNKQRICAALEDEELNSRLTSDPLAAQVHMTPLMEIRAETLRDYLHGYRAQFSRVVGFRPSGWNYRPPAGRMTDSPTVHSVLHSQGWKSNYHIGMVQPQRGSTSEALCYGVPYSEHSSFRELTAFCVGLNILRVIPTVNVGSASSREKMKLWIEKWTAERRKSGYYKIEDGRQFL